MITEKRKRGFDSNKYVPDIDDNQPLLIEALDELRLSGEFILDGHFCLLDGCGNIKRIPSETYSELCPDRIILLTEEPDIIASRRKARDNVDSDVAQIAAFQAEEISYASEIASMLNVPLFISRGKDDLQNAIRFIKDGGF